MAEHDAIADRAKREVDALARLRRERPCLFYFVIVVLLVLGIGFLYDRFFGIPALRGRLDERDRRIVLLETQLAPFRALAIDRFPGQAEGEALTRLATQIEDLRRQFQEAQNLIHSFAVNVSVLVEGQWKDDKPPDPHLIQLAGSGSTVSILFQVEGDPDRALAFAGLDSFRVSKVSATVADVTYGATPAPGSWVFGLRREKFLACKEVDLVLCGFNAQLTVDSRITI